MIVFTVIGILTVTVLCVIGLCVVICGALP
jgi:hypothetical protein